MFYDRELQFLCDTLRKSGVQVNVSPLNAPVKKVLDSTLEPLYDNSEAADLPLSEYLGKLEPNVVYKMTDSFKFGYIYFLLPDNQEDTVFLMGPYTPVALTSRHVMNMAEKAKLHPKYQRFFDRFYTNVPVIPESSHLFVMLDIFCELIWDSDMYSIMDLDKERQLPASPINSVKDAEELDEVHMSMKLMEKRYKYENELMQAVSLGQIHKVNTLMAAFSEISFEKRVADPLRNMKNYCIIMNTLLRKAAENGGVHPVYLDSVSSQFAVRIEQIVSVSNINNLMREIFRAYCMLVRKHSMKSYSPLVQNTIIFIESDLSANLSLNSLASVQKVSSGYLSTLFKRETGKTVTEYIREKRIKHATHLLSTTHLQIQTIALQCGIMDLQYFSKLFKRHTGMTPKEYRESMK